MRVLYNSTVFGIFFALISLTISLSNAQQTPYVPYTPNKTTFVTPEQPGAAFAGTSSDTIVILKNTISFHPLLMVDGTVALGYERTMKSRRHSARIILGHSFIDQSSYYESKVKNLNQFYAELNYKFFLSRKKKLAPVGLYAAPFAQYRHATYDYESDLFQDPNVWNSPYIKLNNLETQSVAGGIMLGYLGIILEMITLEAYVGVGEQVVTGDYKFNIRQQELKPLNTGFFWNNGPLFKLGASLGVNF